MYENKNNIISEDQHDFVKSQSTVSNLVGYYSFVSNAVEDGFQVGSVYTDFLKAFDRIRQCLLLDKMLTNARPTRCLWLRSYLSGRMQCIS
jgi:hypothetical protein